MFTGLEADRRGIHQPANPGKSREYFFELKCFFLTCGMGGLVECPYYVKAIQGRLEDPLESSHVCR